MVGALVLGAEVSRPGAGGVVEAQGFHIGGVAVSGE